MPKFKFWQKDNSDAPPIEVHLNESEAQSLFSTSLTKLIDTIRSAVYKKWPSSSTTQGAWPREVFTDRVIIERGDKLFSVAWSLKDGAIDFGAETEVEEEKRYVSVGESVDTTIQEAGSLAEAKLKEETRILENVCLLRAGKSKNRFLHEATIVEQIYPSVFEGAPCYFGHVQSLHERSDPRNVGGVFENVRFNKTDSTLRADLNYNAQADAVIALFQEAAAQGQKDQFGLSIQAKGKMTPIKESASGQLLMRIDKLVRDETTSCDLVVSPSAGGRLFEAEHANQEGVKKLEELERLLGLLREATAANPNIVKQIEEAIKAASQPASATATAVQTPAAPDMSAVIESAKAEAQRIVESAKRDIEVDRLITNANLPEDFDKKVRENVARGASLEQVKEDVAFFKNLAGSITNASKSTNRVSSVFESQDKLQIALDQMMGVKVENNHGVQGFRGLTEAYVQFTGDTEIAGQVKVTESLTTASWPYALGDSITRRVLGDYQQFPVTWDRIASTGSAPDFRSQEGIRYGYLADLDDVNPETEDYTEMADMGDEKVTATVGQKGNLIRVTRKMLINDDLNGLQKIVGRIGRSAARTLDRAVMKSTLADNATYTGDSTALFIAGHSNLGAVAMDAGAIESGITAMKTQTELSSGEKLGVPISREDVLLLVPDALEWVALEINNWNPAESYNSLYKYFGQNAERIIDCPWFTDTNDWYLALRKEAMDWLEVIFLKGQQTPEIFLADNPLVGDMFFVDKLVYKVRHEYVVRINDYRGAYKSVAA